MKTISLAVATALYLTAACASAASLSISPPNSTALPGAGNPTNPTTIAVQYDNAGYAAGAGDSIDAEVAFDATKLSVTVTGGCAVAPGTVIVAAADAGGNTIASGAICTMTFTTLAGAANGDVIALTIQNVVVGSNGAADPVQPTETDGTITISAAPVATPPGITGVYVPRAGVTGQIGATVAVGDLNFTVNTPAANGGTGSVVCSDAAGGPVFTINPASQLGLTTTVADPVVSCPLTAAAQTGDVSCVINGGAPQTFAGVTCPAGSAAPPVAPAVAVLVPASSLWSKVGLIGLLAVLGLLVVGFRRQH